MSIHYSVRLTNKTSTNRVVVLEPWTGEYRLPAGQDLIIAVEGEATKPLVIELEGDRLTVIAPDSKGALLTAFRDGKELKSEHADPTR